MEQTFLISARFGGLLGQSMKDCSRIGMMLLPMVAVGALADDHSIVTAAGGKLAVRAAGNGEEITYRNQTVLKIAPDSSASLFRISATSQPEYVIVETSHGGLHCHSEYILLELPTRGPAVVSNQFGECSELAGAGFIEGAPVVHLSAPYIEGQRSPPVASSNTWRNATMSVAFTSTDICAIALYRARSNTKTAASATQLRLVTGVGRLQFLSAPDDRCRKAGVFVVRGDSVVVKAESSDFASVTYSSPKTNTNVEGWVRMDRLSIAPAATN
jgi:hypothetical protein